MSEAEATEVAATPVRGGYRPMAGRYGSVATSSRALEVARQRGKRGLRLAVNRAVAHLSDPTKPIDGTWVKLFAELADRVGLPRIHLQGIESKSTSEITVGRVSSGDVDRAIAKIRANPEQFVVRPIDPEILRAHAAEIERARAKAEEERTEALREETVRLEERVAELRTARDKLLDVVETRPTAQESAAPEHDENGGE